MILGAMIISLVILLLIGMPIGFVLLAVGSFGILLSQGYDSLFGILSTAAYSSVNSFTYSAIPLFILMAHFISKSKIADELFDSVIKWLGHLPGGTGITTIMASAGFGALSGSSVAATSTMSQIAVPQMIKANYSQAFSTGLVATCTGTLAVMIPPSVPLILYGIQTENSIGKLLISGIIPGILLAFLFSLYVFFWSLKSNTKTQKFSWKERWLSVRSVWPMILLVLSVLFIIYFGIGTTTEAAAFGAFGAFVIGVVLRRLDFDKVLKSLIETSKQTVMIFTIIVGAHVFSYYVAMTRIGYHFINVVEESGLPSWSILIIIILFYLLLGMFIEMVGAMLLTLPLVYPLIIGLGYDPIWFGIILVILLEIGLVTPPVGINLFVTSQHSGVAPEKVFIGSIPFLFISIFALVLLILFPQIILFLPSLM